MREKKRLSVAEKEAVIGEMPDVELVVRRKLINFAIRTCIEAGDPHGQIEKYKGELGRIENEIRKRRNGNGSKPVSVKAQPGRLGASVKNL